MLNVDRSVTATMHAGGETIAVRHNPAPGISPSVTVRTTGDVLMNPKQVRALIAWLNEALSEVE